MQPPTVSRHAVTFVMITVLLDMIGFGLIIPVLPGLIEEVGGVDLAAQGHNVLKIVLLALVALHVLGALYHQFVLKDGLINRMRRAEG